MAIRNRIGCLIVLLAASLSPNGVRAAPNTFNTALPVAEGNFVWRGQLIVRERSDDGPLEREVSINALASVLGYGVNANLAVFAALPYFLDKELQLTTPAGRVTQDTDGVGDLTLFGRYTAFKRDWKGRTLRVAPLFGVKTPTGEDDARDGLGRLPRPLQAGTGGWDGFAGLIASYQTLEYQVDAQALYRRNGRHEGFEPGDEWRLDASFQYRLWPRRLEAGTPGFLYGLMESNLVHAERGVDDERGIGRDPNSGGNQWLIALGLQYVTRRWIAEGTVQLPAWTDPNGHGLEDDWVVRVGFRFQF